MKLKPNAIKRNPFHYALNYLSSALETDGYHVTTSAISFNVMQNADEWCVANVALRGHSESNSYTVMAGLWELMRKLESWIIDDEVVVCLREKGVKKEVIAKMAGRKFEGKVYAVRDGEVLFSGPVMRIEGPKWQVKWVESMFTNHLRRCCSVATKIARVTTVCTFMDVILDGSLRRSNDTDGVWTSRSAYLAGATATSNVKAGRMFNIPWGGTVDHFTIQSLIVEYFDQNPMFEINLATVRDAQKFAFRSIIQTYPKNYLLLVDTIGAEIGIEDAIEVLKELKPKGYSIRIDSGDLAALSIWARKRLDEEGLDTVKISPSGGLSALTVKSLKEQGCPGSIWMFGEYLQFKGERSRDGTTLCEPDVNIEFVSKYAGTADGRFESIKLSENPAKNSLPGRLQRLRMINEQGEFAGDVIVNLNTMTPPVNGILTENIRSVRPLKPSKSKTLKAGTSFYEMLSLIFENGAFVKDVEPLYELENARAYCKQQLACLPHKYKRVDGGHAIYGVGIEKALHMQAYEMGMEQLVVHRTT
tara:strand:- start:132431 stop:134026 length:1596 start_codon:yes stop_codon:yes gene_type:complete